MKNTRPDTFYDPMQPWRRPEYRSVGSYETFQKANINRLPEYMEQAKADKRRINRRFWAIIVPLLLFTALCLCFAKGCGA